MNQSIRQSQALALYRAQLNRNAEAKRQARIEAMRIKLLRAYFRDKSGWLFAAMVAGAAMAVVILKVTNGG